MTRASSPPRDVTEYAHDIVDAALEKKAEDITVIDLRGRASYTDLLIIVTGGNPRQVEAIADHIVRYIKHVAGSRLIGVEGLPEARWVLLDWGDIVCHVFLNDVRQFYDIEGMWMDAPRLPLPESAESAGAAGASARGS